MAQKSSTWNGSLQVPLKYDEVDADLKKIDGFASYDPKTNGNYNVHMIENNATNIDAFLNLYLEKHEI